MSLFPSAHALPVWPVTSQVLRNFAVFRVDFDTLTHGKFIQVTTSSHDG
jgi:hypothetical protein